MHDVVFEPPGEGSWELETSHFQRPLSRFSAGAFLTGLPRGFAEGTARYGMLIDHVKPATVNGFVYTRSVLFGADRPGGPTPAELHDRVMTSVRAFEEKQWRADLALWDEVDRPAAVAAHRAIQDLDPAALSDAELAAHLSRCRDHVEAMVYLHHKYTATVLITVGDFLAGAQQWTGASAGELAALLRGSSPVSTGFAAAELDALAAAIRAGDAATRILAAPASPADTLAALVTDPDAAAPARAYLDAVRFRSVGYDVGDPNAGEMPQLLVEAIRAAVAGAGAAPPDDARLAEIRSRVPAEHVAEFEDRLAEARLTNRLRDERGVYADGWATGLARRAVLEAGRRLHGAGRLAAPDHAVDADAAELGALLRGEPAPSAGEIAERYRWRSSTSIEDAPPLLGPAPGPPPPLDALPPPARRGTMAAGAAMVGVFGVPDTPNTERVLHGLAVNDGVYEGTARLVADTADFARVRQGDVLVARLTSPYFNVVLPLLGAIVTDRGGQLSHAAIVAREYGIPGIVGTREATRTIPDGARVRVDGGTGQVRLLG